MTTQKGRTASLLALALLLGIANSQPCTNAGNRFCSASAYNQILQFQFFDSQISLFQDGFYTFHDETRTAFMNPNTHCTTQGYTQSQRNIQYIQQVGNDYNDQDQNTNVNQVWGYQNTNSPTAGLTAFVGNVLALEQCSYVFNFAYYPNATKTYNMRRFAISIQYVPTLLRKSTILNIQNDYSWNQANSTINHQDMPCAITQFYFHPGIAAIMYLMDDKQTIVVKADRTIGVAPNLCAVDFLLGTHSIGQYSVNMASLISGSLSFTVTSFPDIWVFLNNIHYLVAYGHQTNFGASTVQSIIVKVGYTLTTNSAMTTTVTKVTSVFGQINQIAALELIGFIYTTTNTTGFWLGAINTATYSSLTSSVQKNTTQSWKIYQERADNHMYRPIYGVPSTGVSSFYRITTTTQLVFSDTKNSVDLYNYNAQFSRYHAMVVNPGLCTEFVGTPDFNNLKSVVINLRYMTIEQCLPVVYWGCGDGLYEAENGETCDDGNLISGDGCSSTCQQEAHYSCTQVENTLSVCTAVLCGNGVLNAGEYCDDGNVVSGDGCSSTCMMETDYKCASTVCTKQCGTGTIYQQNYTNGTVFFQEQCNGVNGCNNVTCTPLLGWNCTVTNYATNVQSCTMTCGDSILEAWEVCDDGNNVSGDGCAQGCLAIEKPYECPAVGHACIVLCGNGLFEGNDTSINKFDGYGKEQCDDGNNVDGDGCSSWCLVESGYTCKDIVKNTYLENITFISTCSLTPVTPTPAPAVSQQYYRDVYVQEFKFTNYTAINQTSAKFRLIEYGPNLNLYGVSFVASGVSGTTPYAYEYTKVSQSVGGATTYYKEVVNMLPSVNLNQESVQRNTFGQYYVKNLNWNQLSLYTFIPSGSDVTFGVFHTTSATASTALAGSPEIYFWPNQKVIMARKANGFDWKTFSFPSNVLDMAQNPGNYAANQQIDTGGFVNDFEIEGEITLEPLFLTNYIVTYSQILGTTGGVLRVYNYHPEIDYLAQFNSQLVLGQTTSHFMQYSMVYFGDSFGLVHKAAGSSSALRIQPPNFNATLAPVINPAACFPSAGIANLIFVQRRYDPLSDPTVARDVFGIVDNVNIYQFTADPVANTITCTSQIALPSVGVFVSTNLMIDIGLYQIAVYSAADCTAVSGSTTLTASSAWFYTISTKTWSCMPLDNTPTVLENAWIH